MSCVGASWLDALGRGAASECTLQAVFEGQPLTLQIQRNQDYKSRSFPTGRGVTYVMTPGLVFVYSPAERVGEVEHVDGRVRRGSFFLRFVDVLAEGLGLTAVRLVDASHIEGKCTRLPMPPIGDGPAQLSLTWLRAMMTGAGWYEANGYLAEDVNERAAYRAYVERMRPQPLAAMVRALAAAAPEGGPRDEARRAFLRLAGTLLDAQPGAVFADFVSWVWTHHCEYASVFERYLFSYEEGAQDDSVLQSWQIDIPGELIKHF